MNKIEGFTKRLGVAGVGLSAAWAVGVGFDFVLYTYIIYTYGILFGGLIMIVLSFIFDYATMRFYDWSRKDWLGIETLKELKESSPESMIGRIIAWVMKKSDPVAMVVLSINFSPFVVVTYMRHGAHQYNGLSKRDWWIFITSTIIGNVYWTLAVYMGITLVEKLWSFV